MIDTYGLLHLFLILTTNDIKELQWDDIKDLETIIQLLVTISIRKTVQWNVYTSFMQGSGNFYIASFFPKTISSLVVCTILYSTI